MDRHNERYANPVLECSNDAIGCIIQHLHAKSTFQLKQRPHLDLLTQELKEELSEAQWKHSRQCREDRRERAEREEQFSRVTAAGGACTGDQSI